MTAKLLVYCLSKYLHMEGVYFYHADVMGTPLALTDANGSIVWEADYMPFGEEYNVLPRICNNKRFVGKEKDIETGLSYFGARYMDVEMDRFLAADPVKAVDASGELNGKILVNPQKLLLYGYGLNNPYRYVDPDGEEVLKAEKHFMVGKGGSFLNAEASTENTPESGNYKSEIKVSVYSGSTEEFKSESGRFGVKF